METWIKRLDLAGKETIQFQTKSIEGDEKFKPIAGTRKEFPRTYTIEECQKKIQELIDEDRDLAIRISLTNQKAKAKLIDFDGIEKELSIPELLVLKNDIAPKMEKAAQAIPKAAKAIEIIEKTEKYTKWQTVQPIYKKQQSLSEQGHKIENEYIDYYVVQEVTDYGFPERTVFDKIDKIHAWLQRIKEAINQANKKELVEL